MPTPVSVTMPMMMPTQAEAAMSGMPSRADFSNAPCRPDQVTRVRGLRKLSPTMAKSASVTARNGV